MMEHASLKLDESSPKKFDLLRRLILPFQTILGFPKISMEQCKNFNQLAEKEKNDILCDFKELRKIAHNLGLNSWRQTFLQILYFALCILFYLIGRLTG